MRGGDGYFRQDRIVEKDTCCQLQVVDKRFIDLTPNNWDLGLFESY